MNQKLGCVDTYGLKESNVKRYIVNLKWIACQALILSNYQVSNYEDGQRWDFQCAPLCVCLSLSHYVMLRERERGAGVLLSCLVYLPSMTDGLTGRTTDQSRYWNVNNNRIGDLVKSVRDRTGDTVYDILHYIISSVQPVAFFNIFFYSNVFKFQWIYLSITCERFQNCVKQTSRMMIVL